MNTQVLIIDDELPARQELAYLLSMIPGIQVVAEVGSGQEAMDLLQNLAVDLIFLDIHMPEQDGFSVAKALRTVKNSPYIIFATAYDEYALQAFDTQAADYLLKPFTQERVQRALDKMNFLQAEKRKFSQISQNLESLCSSLNREQFLQKIPVDLCGRMLLIDHGDIVFVKSLEGETLVYTLTESYRVNMSLYEVEERLQAPHFFRSHRSYIVNLQMVKEVVPWFNGTYNLKMARTSEEVPVSRNQAARLKKKLGI